MKRVLLFFVLCFTMLSGYAQTEEWVSRVNMNRKTMWPRNAATGMTEIEICWENPTTTYAQEMQWVREAVEKTWGTVARIEFKGWGKCGPNSRGVRILINDSHPHCKGLGTKLDGKVNGMELNFTFKNFACNRPKVDCIKFIAVHEFGHALGLSHEQNRTDCLCEEEPQGSDGGWYVTPCDPNSVMNYCNKKWTNHGQLSENDVKGIQVIYGKREVVQPQQQQQVVSSVVTVVDELGENQQWESIYLDLGGSPQQFCVNTSNRKDVRTYTIKISGTYTYKIWSSTIYSDQKTYKGYGEGTIYLKAGQKYTLGLHIIDWNKQGYFNLELAEIE